MTGFIDQTLLDRSPARTVDRLDKWFNNLKYKEGDAPGEPNRATSFAAVVAGYTRILKLPPDFP